ncbi:MAG: DUF420 domain-containing protein [Pirellulales bacterium]
MDPPAGGFDGFLGTRASLMLDVVVVAMAVVLPLLGASFFMVRYRRRFVWHKRMQLVLGGLLAVAVTLFELEMRWHGWQARAKPSPYFGSDGEGGLVFPVLYVHLVFSVSTAVLWIVVTVRALRNFPTPPQPGRHSDAHVRWGRLAMWDMVATVVTGWIFYYLAFVASV